MHGAALGSLAFLPHNAVAVHVLSRPGGPSQGNDQQVGGRGCGQMEGGVHASPASCDGVMCLPTRSPPTLNCRSMQISWSVTSAPSAT